VKAQILIIWKKFQSFKLVKKVQSTYVVTSANVHKIEI
jgi:hypothetical protein